ncbi:MAG: hypothetical protein BroJett040_22040 [Oligoflexia bacterium]|nr:MAG: hypothetical protein BroJett040_22040 [Oligoflexia bacterium]
MRIQTGIGLLITLLGCISSVKAGVLADASLWVNEAVTSKTCKPIDQKSFLQLTEKIKSTKCPLSQADLKKKTNVELGDIAESYFFDHQAHQQLQNTECLIDQTNLMSRDSALIDMQAKDIYQKLPLLSEELKKAKEAHYQYEKIKRTNVLKAGFCRNQRGQNYSQCHSEMTDFLNEENKAKQVWEAHQAVASALAESVWSGSTHSMKDLLERLSSSSSLPSEQDVKNELIKTIPKVKAEYESNRKELIGQASRENGKLSFNKLSDTTKRQLVESAKEQQLFKSSKGGYESEFLCRLEGKYVQGRDRLETIATASTFLMGGFGVALSKVPQAVKLVQASKLSSSVRTSATAASGTALAIDSGLVVNSLAKACVSSELKLMAQGACQKDTVDYQKLSIKTQQANNCLLEAALDLAPAGLLTSSKAYLAVKNYLTRTEAEKVVGRTLSPSTLDAIQEAHLVGHGEVGADGTVARIGNYTDKQLLKKARILKTKTDLTPTERRLLFKNGIVGDSEHIDELIKIEDDLALLEKEFRQTNQSKSHINDLVHLKSEYGLLIEDLSQIDPSRLKKLRTEVDRLKAKPNLLSVADQLARQGSGLKSKSGLLVGGPSITVETRSSEKLKVMSNPKHTEGGEGNRPNAGIEPAHSIELFIESTAEIKHHRYAVDKNTGHIHRYCVDKNISPDWHWCGSTDQKNYLAILDPETIPAEVKRMTKCRTHKEHGVIRVKCWPQALGH